MTRYRYDDEDVVAIVGSGAGGGTLTDELTRAGHKVVILEAGHHHEPEEFVNDEWRSFKQLARLDKRTTSGSFRVAKDSPNLPAWVSKTVGGTTVQLGGLLSSLQGARVQDLDLLRRDGRRQRARLADLALRHRAVLRARRGEARADRDQRHPAAAGQQGVRHGAQRVGYKRFHTGQLRSGSIPTGHAVWDGRDPGSPAPVIGDAPQFEQPQPATS